MPEGACGEGYGRHSLPVVGKGQLAVPGADCLQACLHSLNLVILRRRDCRSPSFLGVRNRQPVRKARLGLLVGCSCCNGASCNKQQNEGGPGHPGEAYERAWVQRTDGWARFAVRRRELLQSTQGAAVQARTTYRGTGWPGRQDTRQALFE